MERKRVLIVDDEPNIGKMVKLNLEETGVYEVRMETMGKSAVEAAREFKPRIIFLDIVMPDMDGPAVAKELKYDMELRNIPIVFLTAIMREEELSLEGGFIGEYPCIAKPISTEKLIECIEDNLDRHLFSPTSLEMSDLKA